MAQLSAAGAVFHLPRALMNAYGDVAGYDLRSGRGLLQYVIDFANRLQPKVTAEEIRESHIGGTPLRVGDVSVSVGIVMRPMGRGQLRQLLEVAVRGPSAPADPDFANPSDKLLADIRRRSREIGWVHRLERSEAGACWRHHAFIPDFDAFLAFITTLLMDAELRGDLGHCQYRGCGNFFLSKDRKLYCDDVCMRYANTQDSATRKNKERARKALSKGGWGNERVHEAVELAFKEHPEAKAKQLTVYAEAILKAAGRRTRK